VLSERPYFVLYIPIDAICSAVNPVTPCITATVIVNVFVSAKRNGDTDEKQYRLACNLPNTNDVPKEPESAKLSFS
jgi:hypothetical protein